MNPSTSRTTRAASAAGRAAQALLSAVLLAAVLFGFPLLMSQLVGWPLPETLPTLDALRQVATEKLSARTIVDVLAVGAWLAWAHFVACVLVELGGALTGRHLRVPFGGVNQQFAGKLVAAVLLTATVSASSGLTPAAAYANPAPTAATVGISQAQLPAGNVSVTTPPAPASARSAEKSAIFGADQQAWRLYTVVGAHQGYADNLWDIAEQHLSDGTRWREVFELNRGRDQTAGGRLTDPDVLRAGWQLRMPADATDLPLATPAAAEQQPAGQHVVQPGETLHGIAHEELGAEADDQGLFAVNAGRIQADGGQLSNPDLIRPGWVLDIPGAGPGSAVTQPPAAVVPAPAPAGVPAPAVPDPTVVPAPSAVTPQAPPAAAQAPAKAEDTPGRAGQERGERQPDTTPPQAEVDQDENDQVAFPVRTVGGVGALLAAGVLALLAARRQAGQRRRKPGQRLVMPTGPAADVEQELRAIADPLSVETIDLALRHMAAGYAHAGQGLPVVRAARLTADQFDLYLAEPASLPAPFRGTVDACVWTVHADAPELQGMELADVAAPYPSLVTVGHDADGGHVLLDLEYLGALGVDGDPGRTRAVLAAIAVELATSVWADDLQVTVVGAFPELESGLGTGRIQYLPAVGQLLEHLRVRASADRGVLAAVGAPDLSFARANDLAEGIWTPEIVLLAGPISDSQRATLEELTRALPRVAVAAVTRGEPVAEWVIRLDRDDPALAVIDPIGLRIQPQQLDEHSLEQVLEVLGLADQLVDRPEGELAAEVTLDDLAQVQPTRDEVAAGGADEAVAGGPQDDSGESGPNLYTDLGELLTKRRVPDGTAAPALRSQAQVDVVDETPAAADAEPQDASKQLASAQVYPLPGAAPRVLLLGPVTVVGALGPLERKPDRYVELAAFLTLHPGSDHHAIDAAYSPEEPLSAKTRRSVLSRLRRWLGRDDDGKFYLPTHPVAGRYRLSEAVRSDWQRWCELLPEGLEQASTEALIEALALVRGRPGGDIPARRYTWAEYLFQEMISAVGDAAYELARRKLLAGQWRAAEQAAVVGLMVEPGMEALWRARILAAYSSGNDSAVQEAIDRLMHMAARLGTDLEDETEQLLEQLQDTDRAQRELLVGQAL